MLDEIRKVIEKWMSKNLTDRLEAIVRQDLVVPILGRLGWDVESHDEVHPEYSAERDEVDYALLLDQAPKVFIEAKKEDEPLEKHQEQLLKYAFKQGVVMAVLTNGTTWWFYLPRAEGKWKNRKFAAVNIDELECPSRLKSFLSKENVTSGNAIRDAIALLNPHQISESLPNAWEAVKPDIVHLLTDKTEELCGYRPNTNEAEQFLSRINNQTVSEAGVPEPQADPSNEALESDSVAGMRPRSFTFLEVSHSVNSWRSVLTTLCGILHTMHRNRFEAEVLNLRSTKGNPYFSRNVADLRQSHEVNESGIFVETHMSANYIVRRARMLISHFKYAQDVLRFEYSPNS